MIATWPTSSKYTLFLALICYSAIFAETGYDLDILIQNAASVKHVQYGDLLKEMFRKYRPSRNLDVLFQYGVSLCDVPCGIKSYSRKLFANMRIKLQFHRNHPCIGYKQGLSKIWAATNVGKTASRYLGNRWKVEAEEKFHIFQHARIVATKI